MAAGFFLLTKIGVRVQICSKLQSFQGQIFHAKWTPQDRHRTPFILIWSAPPSQNGTTENDRHLRLRQAGLTLPRKQNLRTCDARTSRGWPHDLLRDTRNTLAGGTLKMGMAVNMTAT